MDKKKFPLYNLPYIHENLGIKDKKRHPTLPPRGKPTLNSSKHVPMKLNFSIRETLSLVFLTQPTLTKTTAAPFPSTAPFKQHVSCTAHILCDHQPG